LLKKRRQDRDGVKNADKRVFVYIAENIKRLIERKPGLTVKGALVRCD